MVIDPVILVAIIVASVAVGAIVAAIATRSVMSKKTQDVSEEEIRDLVTENDELMDDEKRMIHEIIDLGDMAAAEIMTPRVDMMLVEDSDTVRQSMDRMQGTGYSRLPVYHEDYDNVIGVVHYKDLAPLVLDGHGDDPVGDHVSEAMFVPETKDVIPLLSEMQSSHQQMAVVVDEYGGTGGLITIEDIVEEVVGEIVDETDREGSFLRILRKDEWIADGRLSVEDAIGLGWPVEESDDYETLAGWLLTKFDSFPVTGDSVEVEGFSFKIEGMRRRRIQRVRTRRFCAEESISVK